MMFPAGSLLAQVATLQGRKIDAAELALEAADAFQATDMALLATVARRCRRLLMGGENGRTLVEDSAARMRGQGIRNPERFAAMLAPGIVHG